MEVRVTEWFLPGTEICRLNYDGHDYVGISQDKRAVIIASMGESEWSKDDLVIRDEDEFVKSIAFQRISPKDELLTVVVWEDLVIDVYQGKQLFYSSKIDGFRFSKELRTEVKRKNNLGETLNKPYVAAKIYQGDLYLFGAEKFKGKMTYDLFHVTISQVAGGFGLKSKAKRIECDDLPGNFAAFKYELMAPLLEHYALIEDNGKLCLATIFQDTVLVKIDLLQYQSLKDQG